MRVRDKENGVWVWQIDIRINLKDRGIETVQINIWTAEIQVKLLFKYLEFMAEFGEVEVVE